MDMIFCKMFVKSGCAFPVTWKASLKQQNDLQKFNLHEP